MTENVDAPSGSVVNFYHLPKGWESDPRYIYIGRGVRGLSGINGKWGNPFKIPQNTPDARGIVLQKYTYWITNKITESPEFAWEVKQLANKTLVCFCAPKPCHGDILHNIAVLLNDYI